MNDNTYYKIVAKVQKCEICEEELVPIFPGDEKVTICKDCYQEEEK
jgi:hypothetical protein